MPRKPKKKPRRKTGPSKWPKLLYISGEMKPWSAMLEQELAGWADVTSRPMFGMVGFYHHGAIFAAVPRTRALGSANAVIFRFDPMPPSLLRRARDDRRIDAERDTPGGRWYSFEVHSGDDLHDLLWWLHRAHQAARKPPPKKRTARKRARR
jgi:hypothetical protein